MARSEVAAGLAPAAYGQGRPSMRLWWGFLCLFMTRMGMVARVGAQIANWRRRYRNLLRHEVVGKFLDGLPADRYTK